MSVELSEELYPTCIKGVPANLTVPNGRYRRSVVIVLLSLMLFVVFYLCLAATSFFLLYEAVTYPMSAGGSGSLFLKGGSIAGSAMLCFFLVKGVFKRRSDEDPMREEITRGHHAEVFQAHHQIAAMLGNGTERELYSRYQFQMAIQGILMEMNVQQMVVSSVIGFLQSQSGPMNEAGINQVSMALRDARRSLAKVMADAVTLPLPALTGPQPGLRQAVSGGPETPLFAHSAMIENSHP